MAPSTSKKDKNFSPFQSNTVAPKAGGLDLEKEFGNLGVDSKPKSKSQSMVKGPRQSYSSKRTEAPPPAYKTRLSNAAAPQSNCQSTADFASLRNPAAKAASNSSHATPTPHKSTSKPQQSAVHSSRDQSSNRHSSTAAPTHLQSSSRNYPAAPSSSSSVRASNVADSSSVRGSTAPPPNAKSFLTSQRDKEMSARQTKIETLPKKERAEQEEWALGLIERAGVCPRGFGWERVPGGYRCSGGNHLITDELLAEGLGGYYECCPRGVPRVGPLYAGVMPALGYGVRMVAPVVGYPRYGGYRGYPGWGGWYPYGGFY